MNTPRGSDEGSAFQSVEMVRQRGSTSRVHRQPLRWREETYGGRLACRSMATADERVQKKNLVNVTGFLPALGIFQFAAGTIRKNRCVPVVGVLNVKGAVALSSTTQVTRSVEL